MCVVDDASILRRQAGDNARGTELPGELLRVSAQSFVCLPRALTGARRESLSANVVIWRREQAGVFE